MRAFALIMVAFGFLMGPTGFGQDAQGDKAKIQGTWKIVSIEVRAPKDFLPKDALKAGKVVITGDKMSFSFGKVAFEVRYKLDPGKKPKTIDLLVDKEKEAKALGVYLLEGDDLKLCWNANDTGRPTEFTKDGKVGQDLRFFILKREKKN